MQESIVDKIKEASRKNCLYNMSHSCSCKMAEEVLRGYAMLPMRDVTVYSLAWSPPSQLHAEPEHGDRPGHMDTMRALPPTRTGKDHGRVDTDVAVSAVASPTRCSGAARASTTAGATFLACGTATGAVLVYRVASSGRVSPLACCTLQPHLGGVHGVSFDTGRPGMLASCSQDGSVVLCDVTAASAAVVFRSARYMAELAAAERDDAATAAATLCSRLDAHGGWSVNTVQHSGDGLWIATGGNDSAVNVYRNDVSLTMAAAIATAHAKDVYCVAWSTDSTRLLSGSVDGTCCVYRVRKGVQAWTAQFEHVARLNVHASQPASSVFCAAFAPGSSTVVAIGTGQADRCGLSVWDVSSASGAVESGSLKMGGSIRESPEIAATPGTAIVVRTTLARLGGLGVGGTGQAASDGPVRTPCVRSLSSNGALGSNHAQKAPAPASQLGNTPTAASPLAGAAGGDSKHDECAGADRRASRRSGLGCNAPGGLTDMAAASNGNTPTGVAHTASADAQQPLESMEPSTTVGKHLNEGGAMTATEPTAVSATMDQFNLTGLCFSGLQAHADGMVVTSVSESGATSCWKIPNTPCILHDADARAAATVTGSATAAVGPVVLPRTAGALAQQSLYDARSSMDGSLLAVAGVGHVRLFFSHRGFWTRQQHAAFTPALRSCVWLVLQAQTRFSEAMPMWLPHDMWLSVFAFLTNTDFLREPPAGRYE